MQNKIISSPKTLNISKQQKTLLKQPLKTNSSRQELSNLNFFKLSKTIRYPQQKQITPRTTVQSTARKYQLDKTQTLQSVFKNTVTSSFIIGFPKDTLPEQNISKKASLQESILGSIKAHNPTKNQNRGYECTKDIQLSDKNYNKIMEKVDKKQKLLSQLKKLSGAIITETMKTMTQLQKIDKKDREYYKKLKQMQTGSLTNIRPKQSLSENVDQFNKQIVENSNNSKNDKSITKKKGKILIKQCIERQEKVIVKKQEQEIKKCKSSQLVVKNEKDKQKQNAQFRKQKEKKILKKISFLTSSHDRDQYQEILNQALTNSAHLSSKLALGPKLNSLNQKSKDPLSPELKYIQQKHYIKDFQLQKSLGQGKFGIVYQVIHKQTKTIYALKKMSKQVIRQNGLVNQFIQQIKIQSYCDHQNILQLYGFFHDQDYFYMILEYMQEGTLFSQLKKSKSKNLGQLEAAVRLKHLAQGVKYLHKQGIAHRDIKPENIVMSNGVGKLCDFGWAAICKERRKTYCGTFDYVAPQILQGEEYDMSVDLWCLGVLAYELLVGKAPFYHVSRRQTMKRILNVESTALQFPAHLSKASISFIERLIKKNPQQRMTAQDILKHPFLVQVKQKSI